LLSNPRTQLAGTGDLCARPADLSARQQPQGPGRVRRRRLAEIVHQHAALVGGAGAAVQALVQGGEAAHQSSSPDRKSTRLNSSHVKISYAVFCLKKKKQ